jgi:amino acid adenylation domain-containing protein
VNRNSNIFDAYHLTSMQEGILFHSLQDEEANEYIVQVSCKLTRLETDRWRRAWNSVIAHHEILRAGFSWKKVKRAVQVIAANAAPEWNEIDARLPDATAFNLTDFLAQDRAQGLNLSSAPLMRMTLVRLSEHEYQFVWTYHHLILDGWSALIVMSDVMKMYQHPVEQTTRNAPRFKDFARWLEHQDGNRARQYWSSLLANHNSAGTMQLPEPSAPGATQITKQVRLLSPELSHAVETYVRTRQMTLAHFMQSMWAVALHRYSNASEICFGWVMSVRPHDLAQASEMVGLMIATVPLLVSVEPSQTLKDLYAQVALRSVEANEYGHLSLAEIKRVASIDPRQELFESVMIFENLPTALKPSSEGELMIEDRRTHWQTNYPLSLMIAPGHRLKLEFSFDSGRFSTDGIERILEQLERLVSSALQAPQTVQQLLDGASFGSGACTVVRGPARAAPATGIAKTILAHADSQPHRIAIVSGADDDCRLTYAQLAQRSRSFAQALTQAGIEAGDVVAIHLPRSPALVVAMLGILQLKATLLPIDPMLPLARKHHMLKASGARIAVAWEPPSNGFPTIALDQSGVISSIGAPALNTLRGGDERIAYLMFTSGTTGMPKAVSVPHSALENVLHAMALHPGFSAEDVMLAVTTVSFDISVLELLLPVMSGGRLVIAAENMVRDADLLARAIEQFDITVMQATPTSWRMLLESGWQGRSCLRAWCGGEALSRDLADRLLACTASLWNLYGPTETTIWTMVAQVQPGPAPIELGRPINNVDCYILDQWLRAVPDGVAGELYFAGACLAQGYAGNPGATANAFIANPMPDHPGQRMYRTGDLARVDAHGRICFIGRSDTQVKLRGVRIELGEIEALLSQHPQVSAVAVKVVSLQGHDTLVAYVVSAGLKQADIQLIEFLKPHLSSAAIPAKLVHLDALPVSSNGKVDRQALPTPLVNTEIAATGPRTLLQDAVGEIWCSILGVATFQRDDNFFALGGHSLKAISLMSAINRTCHVSLPLATIFENPGAGQFVTAIEQALRSPGAVQDTLPPVDLAQLQPASATQERLYYVTQISPANHPYQLSAAVRFEGSVDLLALRQAVETLQQRNAILRTTFVKQGDSLKQKVFERPTVALEVIDLRDAAPNELERRMRSEISGPLLLEERVPVRCIFMEQTASATLLLIIHHILVDEWSLKLLIDDLGRCYEAAIDPALALPDTVRPEFAQYAALEQQHVREGHFNEALRYWSRHLSGVRPTTLALRRPRPAVPSFVGGHHTLTISPATMTRLGTVATLASATRFAALMSAFSVLLHLYHADKDICLGTMDAGRDEPWLESVVGPLSRPLVMRIPVCPDDSFKTLLATVQQVFLDAHRHRAVPFQQLVQRLDRHDGISQLFRIMIVMQNMPAPGCHIAGIPIKTQAVDSATAETDLLIEMFELDRGLTLRFTYDTDLFDLVDIETFAQRFQRLLDVVVDDANVQIASIDLRHGEDQRMANVFNERWTTS